MGYVPMKLPLIPPGPRMLRATESVPGTAATRKGDKLKARQRNALATTRAATRKTNRRGAIAIYVDQQVEPFIYLPPVPRPRPNPAMSNPQPR